MKAKRARITIQWPDDPTLPSTTVEYEACEVTMENGILATEKLIGTVEIQHNGQARMQILAWTGCAGYDAFQAETRFTESLMGGC